MVDVEKQTDPETAPHYTRAGDTGTTRFGDDREIGKDDDRLGASADCTEANAAIGLVLALGGGLPVHVITTLSSVQHDLFDLITGLQSAGTGQQESDSAHVTKEHIERLETLCDHYSADLSLAGGYVLPGGTVTSALLFQAWSVTRRAERTTWTAIANHPGEISPLPARYLNRLSTLLFVLGRAANSEHGDVMWYPMASITATTDWGPPKAAAPDEDSPAAE